MRVLQVNCNCVQLTVARLIKFIRALAHAAPPDGDGDGNRKRKKEREREAASVCGTAGSGSVARTHSITHCQAESICLFVYATHSRSRTLAYSIVQAD